ncbi:hypothetical protein LTR94_030135, partial [Friedmanniomyces endolithicus]
TLDRVDDFAELGKALRDPVKHYSSGMRARLAFGLSLAIEFDCYLIDELVAVGDARFQRKCQEGLFEERAHRAFLMASHDVQLIANYCDRALIIESGRAKIADINVRNWIVLPKLPNRQDWIARLNEAAAAAGYVLHDWDENQAFDDAAPVLLLTASADEARSRQPDASRIAAVLDALDIIIPDEMEQAERHRVVHAASQGFAQ